MKRSLLALYAAFAARYLTSFFSLPFLARVLGPSGLGDLALATAVAAVVSIWVEYGFSVSALREISAVKPDERGGVLIGVTVAKLALFALAGLAFVVLKFFMPSISRFPVDLGLVVLLGGVGAFNLGWYFLGTGRATVSALIDGVASMAWFIPAFFLVRSSSDVTLVIGCQLVSQAVIVAVAHGVVLTSLTDFSVDWGKVLDQLKTGAPLFIKKIAMAAYSMTILLILGAMAGQVQVGYFNAAERFVGTVAASFYPAAQAVMPYLFSRVATDGKESLFETARSMTVVLLVVSIAIAITIYAGASMLILAIVGSKYSSSIAVLQLYVVALPLIALNQGLGLYIMLPLRLDVSFVVGVLLGECVSLCVAYLLAPAFGASGVAFARVVESLVTVIVFAVILYKKGHLQKLLPGVTRPAPAPKFEAPGRMPSNN